MFERLLGLLQAVIPQATEFLMDGGQFRARLVIDRFRRESLRPLLQEPDECPCVALLAIELGKSFSGGSIGRVSIDRLHKDSCGSMHIPDRDAPHGRGLGQPVRGVERVGRFRANVLQERCVRLRIRSTGLVCGCQSLAIVRICD